MMRAAQPRRVGRVGVETRATDSGCSTAAGEADGFVSIPSRLSTLHQRAVGKSTSRQPVARRLYHGV